MTFCQDFKRMRLKDTRLSNRGTFMIERMQSSPAESFPNLFRNDSELEGAYRWFSNARVDSDDILRAHSHASAERARTNGKAIVIHDTTDIEAAKDVGLRAHFSLAISNAHERLPLGVVSLVPILRHPQKRKRSGAPREFLRWGQGVRNARKALGNTPVVHVSDCETDSYEFMAGLVGDDEKFVLRMRYDRTVSAEEPSKRIRISTLFEVVSAIAEREVPLGQRRRGNKSHADLKSHPLREGRTARLKFSAQSVVLTRPCHIGASVPKQLNLNVVKVRELEPPEGERPVEWLLITNLSIDTVEAVLEIVDIYRARWAIEEFFKALKTGCALEKRQLESQHALLNATALLVPLALDLLALRSAARSNEDAPAESVMSATRLKVLAHFSSYKMPEKPTVRDAMLAIAKLGGHIKYNGEPGWQVLGRGYEKLIAYESGWVASSFYLPKGKK